MKPRGLPARVLEYVRARDLVRPGDCLLVAVSGGADSLALLDCLLTLHGALGVSLVAGHVDHGLRAASAADADAVATHCRRSGVACRIARTDVRATARDRGMTIEEAGRAERYRLLADLAAASGAGLVATGHTATDQAETVLLRLLRGTGPLGLAAIEPSRGDGVVRPLLCATAEETRGYASERGLPVREDPSNRSRQFLRNRVRLDLLPALRAIEPRVDQHLALLADDSAALASWVRGEARARIVVDADGRISVGRAVLADGGALSAYIVLEAFLAATGAPLGLSRPHVDAVLRLGRFGATGAELHLPRGVTVHVGRDAVVFMAGPPVRR